jgi:hypothetical protein
MSMTPQRRRSAAYRLPGVFALALLGGGGIYTAHQAEQTFSERSATSRPAPELLRLHSTNADVQIVPGSGKRIQIEWRADWVGGRPSHFLRTSGGVIDLGGSCRGGLTHVTGLFAFQSPCSIRYRIAVPAGQAIRLDVDSGDTSLTGLRGQITVHASSGDIAAHDLLADRVELSASSGDISASFDRAPTSLTTTASSGDVSVRVPAGRYHVTASANSGDRSVNDLIEDPTSTRTIVARTHSGDISIGRTGR